MSHANDSALCPHCSSDRVEPLRSKRFRYLCGPCNFAIDGTEAEWIAEEQRCGVRYLVRTGCSMTALEYLEAAIANCAAAEAHHDYSTCDDECCQLVTQTLTELLNLRELLQDAA